MILVDTNVVSELRKIGAGKAAPGVTAWSQSVEASQLYISAISIMELEMGVRRLERRDAPQGKRLRSWFEDQVLPEFSARTLVVDTAVARCCAGMHVPDRRSERDALIAATAHVHGMSVATRNIADFEPTGIDLIDPWAFAA